MSFYTDGKGLPMDDADNPLWFHGSPRQLTTLATGSAMTRNKRLAEAFSHKPTIMSFAVRPHHLQRQRHQQPAIRAGRQK